LGNFVYETPAQSINGEDRSDFEEKDGATYMGQRNGDKYEGKGTKITRLGGVK
jgi:hypothetical protein